MLQTYIFPCLLAWNLFTFTNGFYDQSIECGWPDITRPECMKRPGCQWSPVYGTGYAGASCYYPRDLITVRSQCGSATTTLYECTHDNDCLYEKSTTGDPSCFHRKSAVGSGAIDQSIDCGFPGIKIQQCPIKDGCRWSSFKGDNSCYFPRKELAGQNMVPCGHTGISQLECTRQHCLYDTLAENTTKCFYVPGAAPTQEIPQALEAYETVTQEIYETNSR
ncbi:hypothetical protein K7432_015326 [Basidiobolus ranarum]|uniref:P-type domain-containing protein n=1 Tax=Basidiobolus ranarum TaxID=34480 RepID=A0ABR2VN78_9FUNG